MPENNITQILIRNISLLAAQKPLFINLSDPSFFATYLMHFPNSELSLYTSNFKAHQQHLNIPQSQYFFGAYYESNTEHDLVVIAYPKSKQELPMLLAMLHGCIKDETSVILVGEKNSGINSSTNNVQAYLNVYNKQDSARHCMLYSGLYQQPKQPFNIDDWFNYYTVSLNNINIKVAALPGVFSQKKLDVGTHVLLQNLPHHLTGNILDFGCGAGVIGLFILKNTPEAKLSCTDVSALALTSTEKTLSINGLTAQVFPCDSMNGITEKYHHVMTNPPFHQGIKTHYEATELFLGNIHRHIEKSGTLLVVANSFLQYTSIMKQNFNRVSTLTKENGFTLYECQK